MKRSWRTCCFKVAESAFAKRPGGSQRALRSVVLYDPSMILAFAKSIFLWSLCSHRRQEGTCVCEAIEQYPGNSWLTAKTHFAFVRGFSLSTLAYDGLALFS